MKPVILLHGLGRTPISMWGLAHFLKKEGYQPCRFGYLSFFRGIEETAQRLEHYINRTVSPEIPISLVGHSLGAIIIRKYLEANPSRKIHRVIMLGPPNQGAVIARTLGKSRVIGACLGPAFRALGMEQRYRHDCVEIGIIAGGRLCESGYNPFLSGDNDGIVRVRETVLLGMKDHIIVPCMHSFLMDNKKARQLVLAFLRNGTFSEISAIQQ